MRMKKVRSFSKNKFGNSLYSVTYDHELISRLKRGDSFNLPYTFALLPSVSYLEEYIVRQDVLIDLCNEYELELVYFSNFHEFYYTHRTIPKFQHIMSQIVKVYGKRFLEMFPTSIRTKSSWELASLYKVFVFKRKVRQVIPIPSTEPTFSSNPGNTGRRVFR